MDSNLLNRQYSVLVAGNVDLTKFDLTKPVDPYVVYEYSNRANIRKQAINVYEELIKSVEGDSVNHLLVQMMRAKLQEMQEMSDEEYFEAATVGMTYDKKTGNALTTINPNGKYITISEPTLKSAMPLCGDKFQCLVGDITSVIPDAKMIEEYSKQWDSFMNGPQFNKNEFVRMYGNRETYISVMMESLFYNAFVSNETGWLEQGDENQVQWILTFRERFINNLPKNTPLRVYNFTK
jgi:hypothetical protein